MEKAVILIFVFKFLDCVFGTLKTIFLYKGKHFIQASCVTLSNIMYAVSLTYAFRSDFWSGLIALGLATFIGSYTPAKLMDYLEKDKLYVYEITSDTLESGEKFIEVLQKNNIPFSFDIVGNENLEQVQQCKVYSESKASSRIIMDLKPKHFKFNAVTSIITKE